MSIKRWIACLLLATVAAGCVSSPGPDPSLLRVGMSLNLPPICYKSGGQPAGLEEDFAQQLGKELGRKPCIVVMDFDALIPALESGRIDIIMSGMSMTRLRSVNVRFCDPYIRIGQMALIHSKNRAAYGNGHTMPMLVRSVAVIKGSTGEALARKVFTKRRCNIVAVDDVRGAVGELLAGSIDTIIADAPVIVEMAAKHETDGLVLIPSFLNREDLAWGVNRGNPELQEQVNAVLQRWKASDKLDKTIQRWLPYAHKYDLTPPLINEEY